MATKLIFRRKEATAPTASVVYSNGLQYTNLRSSAVGWRAQYLSTSQGASANYEIATSINGPTAGLELDSSSNPIWISPPLAADTRIYQSVTFNLRSYESSMSANAVIGCRVMRLKATDGTLTSILDSVFTTEATTSERADNWSATPTDTTFTRGDRIALIPYYDDAGTMGVGYQLRFYCDGAAAATGDSYVSFTETFSFESTPAGTTVYPTGTSAGIDPGSATEYEAWTSRGGGVATAVTNTAAGPTAKIQHTGSAGGTAVEWYTKQLTATTLSGPVLVNARVKESDAVTYSTLICEIAICASDGTGATVWGIAGGGTSTTNNDYVGLTTSEAAAQFWVSGDDTAITAGQRIRIRFFVDDRNGYRDSGAQTLAASKTQTLYYAGSAGATGDTYLTFTQTLTEYVASTPVLAGIRRAHQAVTTAAVW